MTKNDGGPAFPCKEIESRESALQAGKIPYEKYYLGMSLRDWFAGKALVAIYNQYGGYGRHADSTPIRLSERCYEIADAMLAQRNKDKE